ncbi:YlmG homolog protein 2, chloroplastic [Linum perenne]
MMMMSNEEQSPEQSQLLHHTDTSNSSWFTMLLVPSPYVTSHPFLRPILRKPSPERSSSPPLVHDLHKCLTAAVENCTRFLQHLTSANPFHKAFLSLSSGSHRPYSSPSEFRVAGSSNFAAILPGDSVAGVVVANGVLNFLNIYNTLLVVRLVLTWFPNSPPAIVSPLSTLCDPYLNIFRGIIPPLGGTLDLSPILAFLVLNAFTSTASAIPAELPAPPEQEIASPVVRRSPTWFHGLTTSQRKWLSRLQSNNKTKGCSP